MSKSFSYAGRTFGLELLKEGNKLLRVVINDGGLEFPFAQGGYDKAADFLVDEYGGSKKDALKVLNETESLEGLEVSGAPATVAPEKGSKKTTAKKTEKKEKAPKEPKEPKPEKAPKEVIVKTFELAGKQIEKKIQVKTILPDQTPERTEDVMLDEVYKLHIDIYSKKNRTSTLTNITNGEVIISGVSLMDVIYAYAAKVGMTFTQADKYIKIKRGLLPEPEKKEKKEKVKAEDLKSGSSEVKSEATTKTEGETPVSEAEPTVSQAE